jgi:TolB-like protein
MGSSVANIINTSKRFLVVISIGLAFLSTPAVAKNAGSVEDGLKMLADQIVEKSVAADRKTIAVLPFPNSDGSCSVLSTYLVDELILGLFSVPNSPVTIIERSQLEALISEMKIGAGGLLNPKTTQKLGSISGVQALTVGTITVIGDTVRVNARVVDTETGRTISAAGVTLPRTSAVTQLLQKPLGSEISCGSNMRSNLPTISVTPALNTSITRDIDQTSEIGNQSVSFGDIVLDITKVIAVDDSLYKVIGVVTNKTNRPLQALFMGPMTLMSELGNTAKGISSTGILPCNRKFADKVSLCDDDQDKHTYVSLTPKLPRQFVIDFKRSRSGKGKFGDSMAFTGRILIISDNEFNVHPINFPNLKITEN